jgi:hypothetical protein
VRLARAALLVSLGRKVSPGWLGRAVLLALLVSPARRVWLARVALLVSPARKV